MTDNDLSKFLPPSHSKYLLATYKIDPEKDESKKLPPNHPKSLMYKPVLLKGAHAPHEVEGKEGRVPPSPPPQPPPIITQMQDDEDDEGASVTDDDEFHRLPKLIAR